MSNQKYLTYRGDIRAVAARNKSLAFVTQHADQLPTALYLLDVEKLEVTEVALPCGGLSLVAPGDTTYIGGDDGSLYSHSGKAKSVSALKAKLTAPATALAMLADDRLAALCGGQLVIVDVKKDKSLQSLELPDNGSAIAADPTGQWLAVGTTKGDVSVYETNDKGQLRISETEKLHEAAVTSLLFEPEELRFFSAGADQKLLLTHARGKLEPEDRGRGNSHSDQVTAMLLAPGERFITASRDKTCKTWARVGATRPATFDDAVPTVVDGAIVTIHERPHLIVAGEDNTLRFILLDAGGRFGAMTQRLYDAYDRASHLLRTGDVAQRGDALHALASYDDRRAIESLAGQVSADSDHSLRLRAAELLAKSSHARVPGLLEPLLQHDDVKVRLVAFEGLRSAVGKEELRPLELALEAGAANVGEAAVEALIPLAKKDELARQLLVDAFNNQTGDVRRAALLAFEKVVAKDSPEPTMIAVKAKPADVRQLGLIRAYQRKLLSNSRVAGAVRRSGEDADADVRRTAFLVALLSRPKLAKAVRERDKELHRQLFELENYSVEPQKGDKAKTPPKVKPAKVSLNIEDLAPLLSAMASRTVDTGLLGAKCLALLGDARALGTLLQLSREDEATVRVEVCRALAALADARAEQRLETLVNDSADAVRDAAYSALEQIHEQAPLNAADIGLKSSHVDVRRRALKTLASSLQKSTKKTIDDDSRELLLRSLNDHDESVSGEAFKTTLGLQIENSQQATLRFALKSVRPSVRREVLTETMSLDKEAWAGELLVDLLNDPSPEIRDDAYQHLLKEGKGRDVTPMRAALASRYSDTRMSAANSLIKLKTKQAQETLVVAINDDDETVRQLALGALIQLGAVEIVQEAMSSQFADVRLQAAVARAMYHDEQAGQPLLETAAAPQPEREADQPQWKKDAVVALKGLATLGSARFVDDLLPLLASSHDSIRKAAAGAIAWSVRPDQAESLTPLLQHDDAQVRFRIALGLALCRHLVALPVVFSDEAADVLSEKDRLMAIVAFGEQARTHLVAMLDSEKPWVRNAAFLVLLFRDWKSHNGSLARLLAALSAHDPRIRLAAARALETFTNDEEFREFVGLFLNHRGEQPAWEISANVIDQLADAIVFSDPRTQAMLVSVLQELAAERQKQWEFAWQLHTIRYEKELAEATAAAKKHKPPKLATKAEELTQLAFGTYVGLVRQQWGGAASFGATVISVRRQAIRRLVDIAQSSADYLAAARPVLIQALGDNYQPVRMLAFELLPQVGCDDESRAEAAIESGQTDLAVEAFKLLSAAGGKKGQKVLEDVILTRDDSLSHEAFVLLTRMTNATTAAKVAVESPRSYTRMMAVRALDAAYSEDPNAKKVLYSAYESRYANVRRATAVALANNKDARAFDMLIEQIEQSESSDHAWLLNALVVLGDARTPAALLDLLEGDEKNAYELQQFFSRIGQFRQPEIVDRLLPHLERKDWRSHVSNTIVQISGHDQTIQDIGDEQVSRSWMDDQHPRHDDVLAKYLEKCHELNLPNLAKNVVRQARWSLSDAVDNVLPLFCVHSDDNLRQQTVEAIGWRLRKRNGPADALVDALQSRDTITKFLAAEGLARGGRDDGITVLLSAVELMSDLNFRRRAVRALGELADERALELLVKLVNDEGHALRDYAATAIGHLSETEKADEVFEILKRLSSASGSVRSRAIIGLRHFNTPTAWDLLREKARAGHDDHQEILLEQLGYNDQPETRQLLLDMLMGSCTDFAIKPARRLFGDESLEPDYAALQSDDGYYPEFPIEFEFHCLQRVCETGDSETILEILPNVTGCAEELAAALMQREPLPIEATAAALQSPHAFVVEVAASIVGRVGEKKHGKPLGAAIEKWLAKWNENRIELMRSSEWYDWSSDEINNTLRRLAWAAGRTQGGNKELFALLESNIQLPAFAVVRRAAVLAIAEGKLTKTDLATLEKFASDNDAFVRQTTAAVIAKNDTARAAKLAEDLISDRNAFKRLNSPEVKTEKVAIANADHLLYQPIVLPELVASGEAKRLSEAAANQSSAEAVQLGAVEALAVMANKTADKQLESIGNNKSLSEEIQKAAWRGLRRSKRAQAGGKK